MGNININSGNNTKTRDIISNSGGEEEPENEGKWKKKLLIIAGIITGLTALTAAIVELIKLF